MENEHDTQEGQRPPHEVVGQQSAKPGEGHEMRDLTVGVVAVSAEAPATDDEVTMRSVKSRLVQGRPAPLPRVPDYLAPNAPRRKRK